MFFVFWGNFGDFKLYHKYWRRTSKDGREDKGKKGMKGNIRDVYCMSDQESQFKCELKATSL